jgi:hypothetical protein
MNCNCDVCAEHKAACEDSRATAEMCDYFDARRESAIKEWARATERFRAAIVARNQQHPADTQAGRP